MGWTDVFKLEFLEDVDKGYVSCLADELVEFADVGIVAEVSLYVRSRGFGVGTYSEDAFNGAFIGEGDYVICRLFHV